LAARITPLFLRSFCASSERSQQTAVRIEDITKFLNQSDEKEELTDIPVAADQRSFDIFDRSAGSFSELLDKTHLIGHFGAKSPVKHAILREMVAQQMSLGCRGRGELGSLLLGTRQKACYGPSSSNLAPSHSRIVLQQERIDAILQESIEPTSIKQWQIRCREKV
jgi:hypothetical protein